MDGNYNFLIGPGTVLSNSTSFIGNRLVEIWLMIISY